MTTPPTIPVTRIKFPEIKLHPRDAHKLRGYFGNLFKAESSLLHNHYQNGGFRYRYPEVQYKVLNNVPTLVGVREGAQLLPQLFLKMKTVDIEGKTFPINTKNIEVEECAFGYSEHLYTYRFDTLWMALNQNNYKKYITLDTAGQQAMLNSIIIGHILGFFTNMGLKLSPEQRVMAKGNFAEKTTKFKGKHMLAFTGSFVTNALLPNYIGLGKSSARGFGTIQKV